jgi:BirA family biotin operon repressor/biotin-[acetyl-CoA-carboxylase] ligase
MMSEPQHHPYTQIARQLHDTAFSRILYLEETGSTNADAAALLGDASAGGLTIVAEHQTRGAGRKGRSWESRPGANLLFSTILPVALDTAVLWVVPFWVALAVRSALRGHHIDTTLHWPNDLLAGDRKLAGILCASRVIGDSARVVCGVGINMRRYPEADAAIVPPAAFCSDVANVNRADLLEAILRNYNASLNDLEHHPHMVARQWEATAGLPGAKYRIVKDGESEPFTATAMKLDANGALVVKHANGATESIALAEARALR